MSDRFSRSGTILSALTWNLRSAGVRVSPAEIEQGAAILSTQLDWSLAELISALSPVFAKRSDQRAMIARALLEIVANPEAVPTVIVELRQPILPSPTPKFQRLRRQLGKLYDFISQPTILAIAALVFAVAALLVGIPGLRSDIFDALITAISTVGAILADPLGKDLAANKSGHDAVFLRHSIVAALLSASIVILGGLLLRWWQRSRPVTTAKAELQALSGDGSTFRVSSLGGDPSPFLTTAQATEIADLIAYRATNPDRRLLDADATLARVLRGDADPLVFKRRRELPLVLLLRDSAAPGQYWNTLPVELQTALQRRGLMLEVLGFPGTLSAQDWSANELATPAELIESMAHGDGWMLTMVFSDHRHFSPQDVTFLTGLTEKGPVIGVDYNDSRLWDGRHFRLIAGGVEIVPATAAAVRQALARTFAPDKSSIASTAEGSDGSVTPRFEGLAQPYAEWAAVCAAIEPMPFALAEQLRQAHTDIVGANDSLAFSLLTNLEGSWVGPEGLRFSPSMRSRLLAFAAETPLRQKAAFEAVLTAAFGREPRGTTASELWRFTRTSAELFSRARSKAKSELQSIKEFGLVDPVAVADLEARLLRPGEEAWPGATASRLTGQLHDAAAGRAREQGGLIRATWSTRVPEMRVRLPALRTTSSKMPVGTFLADGILVCDRANAAETAFGLIDTASRAIETLLASPPLAESGTSPAEIANISAFPTLQEGIITTDSGAMLSFKLSNTVDQGRAVRTLLLRNVDRVPGQGPPILAIFGAPKSFAYAARGSGTIQLVVEDGPTRRANLEARVTALALSSDFILCGTDDGDVISIAIGPELRVEGVRASIGKPISALAATGSDLRGSIIIAADDGSLFETSGLPPDPTAQRTAARAVDEVLPWAPRLLRPFSEWPAGRIAGIAVGVSVAAVGPSGQFHIIGVPVPGDPETYRGGSLLTAPIDEPHDGVAILAVSVDRRRIAVIRERSVEVRPLLYDLPELDDAEQAA